MNKAFEKILERLEERTDFLSDCTKYGNKDAKQQEKSYSIMMLYEVAYLVDDLKEIVKQVAEEYNDGWIPCSERLPEKQGSYLIQDNKSNIKVAYYDYNTQCTYRAWWIDYTKVTNVIAWQPLPQLYKERGNK